jgi:hypothetical protein
MSPRFAPRPQVSCARRRVMNAASGQIESWYAQYPPLRDLPSVMAAFDIPFPTHQAGRILQCRKGQEGKSGYRRPCSGTDALSSRRKTAFRRSLFFERGPHGSCHSMDRPECASYEPPGGVWSNRRLRREFGRHATSKPEAMLYWLIQRGNPVKAPIALRKNP